MSWIHKNHDDELLFNCPKCNKIHKKQFNKGLIKKSANTYEFCDQGINTLILLLRKEIYPYEYIDSWKRFNETPLSKKEHFYYSNLNMEDIRCWQ